MRLWRPHTTGILIGGVLIVVIASIVAFMISNFRPTTDIRLGSGVFNAQLADDETEREQGLSGVEKLNPNDALLMVFDSDGKWGIWMKDMVVPIDIVWLNSDKKVIYIVKNASPELSTTTTFQPKEPARYVIEIAAGGVEKNGVRIGDVASFDVSKEQKL